MVTELLCKGIFVGGNEGRRGELMPVEQERNLAFQVHQEALEVSGFHGNRNHFPR